VASVRRIDADNFIDTAKPPASSDEELIREPLDSLCRLFCMFTFELLKLYAARLDAVFVLILIIFVFLYFIYCSFRTALGPFDYGVRPHPPGFSGKLLFISSDSGAINHRGGMNYRE
jgi:hypothetical protein